jgi:hypothetical protein
MALGCHLSVPVPLRGSLRGYNKAHPQQFGEVLQAWMISQIPGGATTLEQLVWSAMARP